jgi:hypothetical protein
MKTLLLSLLLLSDSTRRPVNFTAKEARILSENALGDQNQRVYDYVKAQIYHNAEQRQTGAIITVAKDKFGKVYEYRTKAQVWTEMLIIKTRLEKEGFGVDMVYNKFWEIQFVVKW